MNIPKATLPLLAAVALSVASADAAVITFNISAVEGNQDDSTYTQTESGVTMVLSNPVRAGFDATFPFWGPDDQLIFNQYFFLQGFDFSFSTDVKIVSFKISVSHDYTIDSTFALSAPGETSLTGIPFNSGTITFPDGGFSLASGQIGTWTANYGPDIGDGQYGISGYIESITVEVVPEPSTYMLLGSAGILGIGAYARNRRHARLGKH